MSSWVPRGAPEVPPGLGLGRYCAGASGVSKMPLSAISILRMKSLLPICTSHVSYPCLHVASTVLLNIG